jgi:ADP-ribose pyrophosphatase
MLDVELTTMCAVFDKLNNKVLFINRKKNWKGYAFPGGHLENGESMQECIIREIYEETGLQLRSVNYIGITHFFNTDNNKRHIVSNFTSSDYEGKLLPYCDEGDIEWVKIKDINTLQLAEGMEQRLDMFLENGCKEMYVEWNETNGYTRVTKTV